MNELNIPLNLIFEEDDPLNIIIPKSTIDRFQSISEKLSEDNIHASVQESEALAAYYELEQAAANAFKMGRSMALEPGNTEFDNPFEREELRESWLYGFRGWRNMNPVQKPEVIKKNWEREGF